MPALIAAAARSAEPRARAARAPRSRAILNLPGLCPVCGGEAPRRLTVSGSERRETYRCAIDGETTYLSTDEGRHVIAPTPLAAITMKPLLVAAP